MEYRPWGLLDWALNLSDQRKWLFVGALATEQRSLVSWQWLRLLDSEHNHVLLRITDQVSKYTDYATKLLKERFDEFRAHGGDANHIRHFDLLAPLHEIDRLSEEVESQGQPVLLDVTSLPKRFFFPILRAFCRSRRIPDLIVTYTSPETYQENEPLSESPGVWAPLPGFPPSRDGEELLIASIGFAVERLVEHAETITRRPAIEILIPFPSTLSSIRHAWRSVWWLEKSASPDKFANHRISAVNTCAAFDRIASLIRDSKGVPAFAPFGPKPISVAMCLHAFQRGSAVYYPQPLVYHPAYSLGVAMQSGKPVVNAYWIKHNGKLLYAVPPVRRVPGSGRV
jgi:hypothetical protein